MKGILALLIGLLPVAPRAADAALIDVVAHAVVYKVTDPDGLLPIDAPSVGADMVVTMRLNTDATDIFPDDPHVGIYITRPALLSLSGVMIGPDYFDGGAIIIQDDQYNVSNNPGSVGDSWISSTQGACFEAPPAPCRYLSTAFVLVAEVPQLPAPNLISDALVAPDWPSTWTTALVGLSFLQEDESGQSATALAGVYGHVDSVTATAVPLPAAGWLFFTGIVTAAIRRRGRRVPGQ